MGYDTSTARFELSPEQGAVFAIDESPVNMIGGYMALEAVHTDRRELPTPFVMAEVFHELIAATACFVAQIASSGLATRPIR
ncbi:hypothetical protein [Pararhizobium sp. DWP3-4]|uniref:hypothetical protein n=1 Tax=Pararhizobium sp. DWP3-4 TaxID=2804565 RepID=UPI003CF72A68